MLSLLQLAFYAVPEEEEEELAQVNLPEFLWQQRCERLFGLSKEYWNLPWTEDVTTVQERYFSLKNSHKKPSPPFCKNLDECQLLAHRMRYAPDVLLLQDVKDFFSQRRDKKEKMMQSKILFTAALNSGREDLVDEMVYQRHVWDFISLPKTIAEVIRPVPFSSSFRAEDYIIEESEEDIFDLGDMLEAMKGGNLRIVLYLEQYCSFSLDNPIFIDSIFGICEETRHNPQGIYSILQYIYSKDLGQSLYKLKTRSKDHLLFALSALGGKGSSLNVSQEKVLRANVIQDLNLAKAFASYLTLDMLNFMCRSSKQEIRSFAQNRLERGEYSRGPIIYGGDVSNKNLSFLPPGLRL